jgi:hypothetical protein
MIELHLVWSFVLYASVTPKKRWIEGIEEDMQVVGIRGWRKLCKEMAEWKKITEKAKTHSGL